MVAVAVVRMVQVTIDQIIDVVTMWHCRVSAAGSMNMIGRMAGARMAAAAGIGIRRTHGQRVFLHRAVGGLMMQMTVVQVVGVSVVLHGDVAAAGTVRVIVIGMV